MLRDSYELQLSKEEINVRESPSGVMAKVLDCDLKVSKCVQTPVMLLNSLLD